MGLNKNVNLKINKPLNRYFFMRTNFPSLFVLLLTSFFLTGFSQPEVELREDKFVVVLDAGHGGHDPGNRGNGYYEKDIALNIVLNIGAELEKIPGIEVIYTRKTDVFVTLAGRAEVANEADADLFISVHCNAHSSQAAGTETFVLGLHRSKDNLKVAMRENSVIFLEENYEVTYDGFDPNSPESYIGLTLMQEEFLGQSILLADLIQKNFTHDLHRINRGVKQAGFLVLRQTVMPSVLIETGFLTNDEEGAYLNSTRGQKSISDAIVDAIETYKNNINVNLLDELGTAAPEITSAPETGSEDDFYQDITFRVQLAATKNKLEPTPANFKGLQGVIRSKEGEFYKYYFGATSRYSQIKQKHEEARRNGFTSSYVVAFKKGKKITVNEALKTKQD